MVRIYLAQYEAVHGREKRQTEHLLGKRLLYQGLKEVYGIAPEQEHQVVILKGGAWKALLKGFSRHSLQYQPYVRTGGLRAGREQPWS